jgi:Domain of unknown function (DUF5668)
MDRRQTSQATTGVLLILMGLIFLSDRLGLGHRANVGGLWPLVLVVAGAARFVSPREGSRGEGGLWLMMIGGIFLLQTFRILYLKDSWPLFIVAFGISRLLCAWRRAPSAPGGSDVH